MGLMLSVRLSPPFLLEVGKVVSHYVTALYGNGIEQSIRSRKGHEISFSFSACNSNVAQTDARHLKVSFYRGKKKDLNAVSRMRVYKYQEENSWSKPRATKNEPLQDQSFILALLQSILPDRL